MQFQLFPNFKSQNQAKETYSSVSEDIPSFDDAFDTDSLKKFYRQQSQPSHLTVCTNFTPFFAKPRNDDFAFDEASSPSIDERETQASPLTRYINKYSQENSMANSPLGVSLNYQFYAEHDPMHEIRHGSLPEIPREPIENYYAKSFGDINTRQPALKLQECGPSTASCGQLDMNASNGVFSLIKSAQPSLAVYRKDTQSTDCSDADRSPTGFEKLLRSKKIFKIERDVRPKLTQKQKVSSPKAKPVKISATKPSPLKLSKAELPNLTAPVVQERSPVKPGAAPVMSFLNIMQERGYSAEQVMTEIQKLMVNPNGVDQFSPIKN